MAGRIAVDTSLLIDVQRERRRGDTEGPAHRFLTSDPDAELFLPAVALGEFAEGFADSRHPVLRAVRDGHVILPDDEETAVLYASIARELRASGALIGANDLWIAATAARHGLPLATGDVAAFSRVPGLDIVAYR